MSLRRLVEEFARAGVHRLYAKALAANDNSKNQIYLGGSLEAVNLLPSREIVPDPKNKKRLKAPLEFSWLAANGQLSEAPNAQLILYPDYPEVRLSGFLKGCAAAPSEFMVSRAAGRVLFLGVRGDGVVARVLGPEDPIAREFLSLQDQYPLLGVLRELPRPDEGDADAGGFTTLMSCLAQIHGKGWIRSWSLASGGVRVACEAPQCGGYTLEAELGIERNGRSAPDFMGWEVKSLDVPSILRAPPAGKVLTLMTPEPTGALYQDDFAEFWKRYSYPDRSGRPGRAGRRNFGGIYRCGAPPHDTTGLRLVLQGYHETKGTFDGDGQLALVDRQDRVAAAWSFSTLLEKWSRKHARAVYVPVERAAENPRRYRYAAEVSIGRATDFQHLLRAAARGLVYLDPALKQEDGQFKKRNQFRVAFGSLSGLYREFESVRTSPLS